MVGVPAAPDAAAIPQFYAGREVFVTGGTGFMGKVLVERLLATCPDIGRLHLLLRTKKDSPPEKRLLDLKQSQVFDVLRARSPGQLSKLRIVCGDITQPDLGLTAEALADLEEVSVVFHSAATVKMQEQLRTAVQQNVLAVTWLLRVCDRLPKLRALVHVSTAYSNAERSLVEERVYPLPRPLPHMIEEALNAGDMTPEETSRFIAPKPNTYTFTKMMAEAAVAQHAARGYPLAIFRPTIVVSSLRHPFPGWVENLNGPSGVLAAVARGALRVVRCRGAARADLLPVDMAIDTLIAVAWETALDNPSTVRVYNCSTSDNPTDWEQLRRSILHGSELVPSASAMWLPTFTFVSTRFMYKVYQFFLQTLPLHLVEYTSRWFSHTKNRVDLISVSGRLCAMNSALEYFATREFAFATDNVRRLRARLSRRDAELYNLDPHTIDWKASHLNFVKGARRHLLNEKDATIPAAKLRMQRIYFIHRSLTILVPLLLARQLVSKHHVHGILAGLTTLATTLHAAISRAFCTITDVYSALVAWLRRLLYNISELSIL